MILKSCEGCVYYKENFEDMCAFLQMYYRLPTREMEETLKNCPARKENLEVKK